MKSAVTSGPSSPATSTEIVVPRVAPSLSIPSILLALTVSPLAVTVTSEGEDLARFTNSAAGRS